MSFLIRIVCLSVVVVFLFACSNSRRNVEQSAVIIDSLKSQLGSVTNSIKRYHSVEYLISNGFTETASAIIEDSLIVDTTINTRLYFAQMCVDNGRFEQGMGYINDIHARTQNFELLNIKTNYALNKMDTSESRPLLDSLKEELRLAYTPVRQIEYLIQKGYHLHNCRLFDSARRVLKSAIDTFPLHLFDSIYLARIYRKLGNSCNDQTRNVIEPNKAHAPLFLNCIDYYGKERAILIRRKNEQNKVIGNLISNGLVMINVSVDSYRQYLLNALHTSITASDSDYIVTADPIYSSVCCNYLAAERIRNFTSVEKALADSFLDLNQRLITQKAIRDFCSARGNEIKVCYPQGNYWHKFENAQKDTSNHLSSLDIANISNLTKYSALRAFSSLRAAYGDKTPTVIKYWALLHEIKLWGGYSHNVTCQRIAEQLLSKYAVFFRPIDNCVHPHKLTQSDIDRLTSYCKQHTATIFDFQVIGQNDKAYLVTLIFDAFGLRRVQTVVEKNFPKGRLTRLNNCIRKDSVESYSKLAAELYSTLSMNMTTTNEVIISPCEQLEQFPLDALITDTAGNLSWRQAQFFSDHHTVHYIPNLESILHESQAKPINKTINILFSVDDNNTLPSNNSLIQDLSERYGAVANRTIDCPILHVIDHTQTDPEGNLYFRIPTNNISISSGTYHPHLAVLHGCSSGNGRFITTEGYLSLTRMFLYNGTNSVINSCWNADNVSSVELFRTFYANLMAGKNVTTSLHTAQLAIKNNPSYVEWASPYYWANWKLTGQDLLFTK